MEYEPVIGLEIHAQLLTRSKIFCGCSTAFGSEPNTQGCPVCCGMPGALPVLNRKAVEMAIAIGLAVDCSIASKSIFARKNYFYPDLPKGYQISQYDMPLCTNGKIDIQTNGGTKRIGITRIHLEEDAGKLIHDRNTDSLFDVNRCGTPLIEIVSEPDIRSGQEAYEYLKSLKQILEYLGICDCNMEEGSLRCDANVSIRPIGEKKLGTKTELKNMNTFRGVERALDYEIKRQKQILESGGVIEQQTFLWDAQKNRTVAMRSKEHAHDYRYFPEPDLVPLIVEPQLVEKIKNSLPELPACRKMRFVKELGLSEYEADVLTSSQNLADYFESALKLIGSAKTAANWVMGEVLRIANETKRQPSSLRITPVRLADVVSMVSKGEISANAAKRVIAAVEEEDKEPSTIVEEKALRQISDTNSLENTLRKILEENPKEVARYKGGEQKLEGFFIGQVMKATKGAANPKEIGKLLREMLDKKI